MNISPTARNATCSPRGFRSSQAAANEISVPAAIITIGTSSTLVSFRKIGAMTGRPVDVLGPIVSGAWILISSAEMSSLLGSAGAALPSVLPPVLPGAAALPGGAALPAGAALAAGASALGILIGVLHFGHGPCLPANWSLTLKLVLQLGQETAIGMRGACSAKDETVADRRQLLVFAGQESSSRHRPIGWLRAKRPDSWRFHPAGV